MVPKDREEAEVIKVNQVKKVSEVLQVHGVKEEKLVSGA